MRFKRQLIGTLAIQGVGAAAIFGAVLLISFFSGPAAQGYFSRVKSEIEFITAISMFGMPQATFFFLNSQRMSLATAVKVSSILGIVSVAISSVYILVTHSFDCLYLLLFSFASAAIVIHGMLRVLVLAFSRTYLFNVVTALPQVLLLILVVAITLGDTLAGRMVPAIFLITYFFGCVFAWAILRTTNIPAKADSAQVASLKELLTFGVAAWSTAGLSTATVVFWLRHTEAALGPAAMGVFAMGLIFVQMVLTPFNYAAPLLFKRWMNAPDNSQATRWALFFSIGSFLFIVIVLKIQEFFQMPESVSAYGALSELKWAFALMSAAEVVIRVVAVSATAAGNPWAAVLAEFVRLAFLSIAVGLGFASNLTTITSTWAVAAVISCAILLVVTKRMAIAKA